MGTNQLTPRQREILDLIRSYIRDTGFPPTRAEIAREFGFRSANAAEEHLRALARRGVIELQPGTSRGIRLTEAADEVYFLPVVGRVAAGSPILAEEHIEDYYWVDPGLFQPRAQYLLRVYGDSMCGIGILDGDLLVVHPVEEAENGQIVVARLDDEVTVKRFKRHARWRHRVQLVPENDAYEPINVDLRTQQLAIEGLGVGVLRFDLTQSKRL